MWLPGEAGRVSTLDLLGDGLTLFTGPGEEAWQTRRGRRRSPCGGSTRSPRGRSGSSASASLLVRPDGVPATA